MKVFEGDWRSQLEFIYRSSRPRVDYHTFKQIIKDYQATMEISNALNFDDLVNEFLELVQQKPWLVSHFRHILVDEFQDTNLAQYKLIRAIARASNSGITVVGDPDQAIYGWRFADKSRSNRSLDSFQQQPAGSLPVLQQPLTIEEEASAVATHIQNMHRNSKGALNYGDFAILLRYNYWRPYFGESLEHKGIPFQFLPNPSFYTKTVVLDLLAYVFLAFSPQDTPWLLRILDNIDSIDAETTANIQRHALDQKTTAMTIVQQMAYDDLYNIDSEVRAQFQKLVVLLGYIKKEGRNDTLPSQILEYILRHTDFKARLRKRVGGYNFAEWWSEIESLMLEAREFERSGMGITNSLRTPMSAYIEHVEKLSKEIQTFDIETNEYDIKRLTTPPKFMLNIPLVCALALIPNLDIHSPHLTPSVSFKPKLPRSYAEYAVAAKPAYRL
ncbi:hypothetical protein FRC11_010739 [Ceratobasidium sp. 423]|nr:hypothetical protein FRC11_010739 [Ceratobasidium sp. 423]